MLVESSENKLNSYEIKIGLLYYMKKSFSYRKRIEFLNDTIIFEDTPMKELRGIIFRQRANQARDLINDSLVFPIVDADKLIPSPIVAIDEYENLGLFLQYYGLFHFTNDDLQKFLADTLLNRKWLKSQKDLFGFTPNNFLDLCDSDFNQELKIPLTLAKKLYLANSLEFRQTKKEKRLILKHNLQTSIKEI